MKHYFCLFAIAFLRLMTLHAQSPSFETTIRIKDALGHWDSVTIGYDQNDIPFDTAQFHEIIDNAPFDSILDVRIVARTAEMIWSYPYEGETYKRLITGAFPSFCTIGGSSILLIQAKYQPVTLYWERKVFGSSTNCLDKVFFTPDKQYYLSEPTDWIDSGAPIIFSCASKSDSLVYTLNRHIYWDGNLSHPPFWPIFSMREVEGIGIDTVVGIGLEFELTDVYSPCRLVSDVEEHLNLLPDFGFSLWPNPAKEGLFSIRNARNVTLKQIQVFDIAGQIIWEKKGVDIQPDQSAQYTTPVPPGIYYTGVAWADGYHSARKWIKI